ncbi:potassium transporter Trk, partial [Bifidobacterium animalis subsp. lactis]
MATLLFDESASNSETSQGFGWWFSGAAFERNAYEERNPHSRSLSDRLNSHP